MRSFAWFLGAMLLAAAVGALVSYPAYELTSTFASWAFHRVASRIAMLLLLLELVWLCRRRFLKVSLLWGAIGAATAGVGAAFLLATHLRVAEPGFNASPLNFLRI